MEKWSVYIHINMINGKVYVGITHFNNPENRWRKGHGYRKTSLFYKAIKKYGWDNFSHIVLGKFPKEDACDLERTLISIYKKKEKSYNIGLGGEGAESFSEETIEKLKQYTPWIKGRHHTDETKKKIGEASRGRKKSEETRRKLSKARKGAKLNWSPSKEQRQAIRNRFSKPVIQYSLQEEFIREFPSATEAENALNGKGSHIGCCCLGKRKTAYGYIWRYK